MARIRETKADRQARSTAAAAAAEAQRAKDEVGPKAEARAEYRAANTKEARKDRIK